MLMTIAAMIAASTGADAAPQDPPAAIAVRAASPTLRAGTAIVLRTDEELRSATARAGQVVRLRVAEPIVVDGHVFVAAGTPAVAEIVKVRPSGVAGYPDSIIARLVSVDSEGRAVRLVGGLGDRSEGATGLIPIGAPVRGFVDEDVAYVAPLPPVVVASTAAVAPRAPTVVEVVERPLVGPAPVRVASVSIPSGTSRNDRGSMTIDFLEKRPGATVRPASLVVAPERATAVVRPVRVAAVTRTTSLAMVEGDAPRTLVRVVRASRSDAEVSSGGVTTRYAY